MKRTDIYPMPEFFERYINLTDDIELKEAFAVSLKELKQLPFETWEAIGSKVYAPGKWTIKDILQHMIDTERILTYRGLCIARGESARLPSFDEEAYAQNTDANHRTLEDLIDELSLIRVSSLAMFNSFNEEMLQRSGLSFRGSYSVLALGFIVVGHQRWHLNIIKERYEVLG